MWMQRTQNAPMQRVARYLACLLLHVGQVHACSGPNCCSMADLSSLGWVDTQFVLLAPFSDSNCTHAGAVTSAEHNPLPQNASVGVTVSRLNVAISNCTESVYTLYDARVPGNLGKVTNVADLQVYGALDGSTLTLFRRGSGGQKCSAPLM